MHQASQLHILSMLLLIDNCL